MEWGELLFSAPSSRKIVGPAQSGTITPLLVTFDNSLPTRAFERALQSFHVKEENLLPAHINYRVRVAEKNGENSTGIGPVSEDYESEDYEGKGEGKGECKGEGKGEGKGESDGVHVGKRGTQVTTVVFGERE